MFVGIDVGKFESALCVIDERGRILRQEKIETSISAIENAAHNECVPSRRPNLIAMEAGATPRRICLGLRKLGYKSIIIDARQAAPFLRSLRAQKTDANDAYAIAELVRLNGHRETWIKSDESQRRLALLNIRDLIIRSEVAVRNSLIGYLSSAGHNVKSSSRKGYLKIFEAESIGYSSELADVFYPLLRAAQHGDALISELDKVVREIAETDAVCQLLMSVPGVGPLTALRFSSYIDDPLRFATSREVGAYLGLVPRKKNSATKALSGGITKFGSKEVRRSLFLAARTLMFSSKANCSLQKWSKRVAERRGKKCAMTALARKLAVVLHAMWISNCAYSAHPSTPKKTDY